MTLIVVSAYSFIFVCLLMEIRNVLTRIAVALEQASKHGGAR